MSANAKVWIDKDTRVICQGFTGKQVRLKCRESNTETPIAIVVMVGAMNLVSCGDTKTVEHGCGLRLAFKP